MLEKPDLPDQAILDCLRMAYDLPFTQVEFLPLGADRNTAVYRARLENGSSFFARLRSGTFDETNVRLIKLMSEAGVKPVIAPLATQTGQLWTSLDEFKLMLYPYIAGRNMYEVDLTDRQWVEFGAALQRLHALQLPQQMAMRIMKERYDPAFRQSLQKSLERARNESPDDPIAIQCMTLLMERWREIRVLMARAQQLALQLQSQELELVLCHADLHAGNLLVENDGTLYIIDWDEILLAPKERDLMYIGGGLLGGWRSPAEEEALFYQGYGPSEIDPVALAYYRYERIIQDLAIYSEELLSVHGSREEREQSFRYMASNFNPGGVLEIARLSDGA
jgi:spectinomycin phosphotransferase